MDHAISLLTSLGSCSCEDFAASNADLWQSSRLFPRSNIWESTAKRCAGIRLYPSASTQESPGLAMHGCKEKQRVGETACIQCKTVNGGFRKLGVPYFVVFVIRILLFRVL